MSLKNFLRNILNAIGHLFQGLLPELKNAVHIGVTITNAIKEFDLTHPDVADIITAIIPGELDNKIKDKIRGWLPKIVVELRLVEAGLGLTDPNEIMKQAIIVLQGLPGATDAKKNFLNGLSILVAQVTADGKLDWNDAAYILKWYYDHQASVQAVDATSVA